MVEEIIAKKNKDRFYRGVNIEDLKDLSIREFSKYVNSAARRKIKRSVDVIEKFVVKCDNKSKQGRPIKTHDRTMIIVPKMVGKSVHVYNGKEFVRVDVIGEMLGHRLGEFAMTRKIAKHTTLKKK